MDTTNTVNALLANEQAPSIDSDQIQADLATLPADSVMQVNLDIEGMVSTIAGATPKILALLPDIVRLPFFDAPGLQKLELYAFALHDAHLRFLGGTESPEELRVLVESGSAQVDNLRSDSSALIQRKLLGAQSLAGLQGLTGYKNIATDLGLLSTVLQANWQTIQGKCAITAEELVQAQKTSRAILRFLGLRQEETASPAAVADTRSRAFTLASRCYDQARRAVSFLRWNQGDADTIAPSLYAGRRRHATPEAVDPQPATLPNTPATPALPAHAVVSSAPALPGLTGLPGSNPFMQ